MHLYPEVPSSAADRNLRTREFAVNDDGGVEKRSGTIQIRVSPFVYSAWGFGVLMPKSTAPTPEDEGWVEF